MQKYKSILTKIEDLRNINLNALPIYYHRQIKSKIKTCCDKAYTNFCGLNVSENDIEHECITVLSIDSSVVYESKYYLQLYLDNCTHKIVNKEIINYLDEITFED